MHGRGLILSVAHDHINIGDYKNVGLQSKSMFGITFVSMPVAFFFFFLARPSSIPYVVLVVITCQPRWGMIGAIPAVNKSCEPPRRSRRVCVLQVINKIH